MSPASRPLAALGVSPETLADHERRTLDRDGYLVLPGLIDPAWLERLRAVFEARIADAVWFGGLSEQECHFYDMANRDPACDRVWTHPRVLAAADHVLGRPFKLSSLNGREARPGFGREELHADWGAERGGSFHVVNSLWLLDDFTAANGATRIVPGSHHAADGAIQAFNAIDADHPDQILLAAPAGTVVVYNAHLWHSGTVNRDGSRRRSLHAYYTAREAPQQLDQRKHLRLSTWRRLDAAQRWLMDVDEPDAG